MRHVLRHSRAMFFYIKQSKTASTATSMTTSARNIIWTAIQWVIFFYFYSRSTLDSDNKDIVILNKNKQTNKTLHLGG